MKIDLNIKIKVTTDFNNVTNIDSFVSLLNYVNSILYGNKSKPLNSSTLIYHSNHILSNKRYSKFTIKKKSGKNRIINSPNKTLKYILTSLNFILQCVSEPHISAYGFVINKSIVDNAKIHVNSNYVYNIDLKDFFHSFNRNSVKMALIYGPFEMNSTKEKLAFIISNLVTHTIQIDGKLKTVLPQGSPTSPTLSNILFYNLDNNLLALAKRYNAKYSRYADDITFSSYHNIYDGDNFVSQLHSIIEEKHSFVINTKKTRLQKAISKQEVTGLTVNEKVNVSRKYIKELRMWLYFWEKYGYNKAMNIFVKDIKANKHYKGKFNSNLINVIHGKLNFLKMVKGRDDSTYKKLLERYNLLLKKNDLRLNQKNFVLPSTQTTINYNSNSYLD